MGKLCLHPASESQEDYFYLRNFDVVVFN